jgi:hypothetical protein
MNRIPENGLLAFSLIGLIVFSCSLGKQSNSTNANSASPEPRTEKTEPAKPIAPAAGDLKAGEASGSYTAKGEVVQLKYAYAGHAQRFGNDSLVILLTDQPIPPEALAEEIKSQTLLSAEKIKGLEYAVDKDGYWVRYHPSHTQESKNGQLKDFVVTGDTVKGSDEDPGEAFQGRYSRSVKFFATISK